jgi:hypothetical protein
MMLVELDSVAIRWVKLETLSGAIFKRKKTGGITFVWTFVTVIQQLLRTDQKAKYGRLWL